MGEQLDARVPADVSRQARMRRTELVISYVLRGGVLLSASIIALGVVLFYMQYAISNGHITVGPNPNTLGDVLFVLLQGNPLGVIALGLLVLLLTPVLRVVVSAIAFALEHDWRYTVITSLVFLILVISFLLGQGGS